MINILNYGRKGKRQNPYRTRKSRALIRVERRVIGFHSSHPQSFYPSPSVLQRASPLRPPTCEQPARNPKPAPARPRRLSALLPSCIASQALSQTVSQCVTSPCAALIQAIRAQARTRTRAWQSKRPPCPFEPVVAPPFRMHGNECMSICASDDLRAVPLQLLV